MAEKTPVKITPQEDVLSPESFRKIVYDYYAASGRHTLPWRTNYNPYDILVSEIMLQQTQVERVIEKFTEFITRFPDIASLAIAPVENVLSVWQGLGYNRRGMALRDAARQIVNDFGGQLPDDPEQLQTLPGIGPATAASITAFAFNRPVVFLETNIRTVLIHHFFKGQDVVGDNDLSAVAELVLDRNNPRGWYSALMDYGTMLKKAVGNLSRKSAAYKKQSPFAGSRRQIRGAILRCLLESKGCTAMQIARKTGYAGDAVAELCEKLTNEKLAVKTGGRYRIAQ